MASSGYIAHVSGGALAELAQKYNLFYVDNLGGGSLVDLTKRGIPECPTLQQGILDNAHLVLASGDKIIGGPQAGIIVGKKDCVSRVSHHVLARTCRPAKLTLAALEATLSVYVAGRAWDEMPTLRLLRCSEKELSQRAAAMEKPYLLPEWKRQSQPTPRSAAAQSCPVLRFLPGPFKSSTRDSLRINSMM